MTRAISDEGLALLRRLRIEYRHRPNLYRDLLALSVLAMSEERQEIAETGDHNPPSEVSVEDAADQLGVTPRTIQRRCQDGTLAAVKRAGAWWINRDALAAYSIRRAA